MPPFSYTGDIDHTFDIPNMFCMSPGNSGRVFREPEIFKHCTFFRYRKALGADDVLVFCDIKKKHSAHSITSDVDIAETAKAAEFFGADGVIVTGTATGAEANQEELAQEIVQI
jgi:LmbE family N-acetylglucosaminyl deacetylase